jgi:putative Mg2+ transporter-C (MgtC) family protein
VDLLDIAARLSTAVVVGAAVGLNRELHDKPAGLRTHALVGLGSALVVIAVMAGDHSIDAVSRAAQGVITGIGFLGGGVIVRNREKGRVHGLTTAATIWVTALFGIACGAGRFRELLVAAVLLFLVLMLGGRIENFVHRAADRASGVDLQSGDRDSNR